MRKRTRCAWCGRSERAARDRAPLPARGGSRRLPPGPREFDAAPFPRSSTRAHGRRLVPGYSPTFVKHKHDGHGSFSLGLDEILFIVMSSNALPQRALWASKTWCSYNASRCIYVADKPICDSEVWRARAVRRRARRAAPARAAVALLSAPGDRSWLRRQAARRARARAGWRVSRDDRGLAQPPAEALLQARPVLLQRASAGACARAPPVARRSLGGWARAPGCSLLAPAGGRGAVLGWWRRRRLRAPADLCHVRPCRAPALRPRRRRVRAAPAPFPCARTARRTRRRVQATLRAQYRFLPALAAVKASAEFASGQIKWVLIVDDDSWVFTSNLLDLLKRFPHQVPLYLGARPCAARPCGRVRCGARCAGRRGGASEPAARARAGGGRG